MRYEPDMAKEKICDLNMDFKHKFEITLDLKTWLKTLNTLYPKAFFCQYSMSQIGNARNERREQTYQ